MSARATSSARRARLAILAWVAALAPASAAAGPSLYHVRGDATLTPASTLDGPATLLGVDAAGYVWWADTKSVFCRAWGDDDPDHVVRADMLIYGDDSAVPAGVEGGGSFVAALADDEAGGIRVWGERRDGDSSFYPLWGSRTAVRMAALDCPTLSAAEDPNRAYAELAFFTMAYDQPTLTPNKGTRPDLVMRGDDFCFNVRSAGLRCLTPPAEHGAEVADLFDLLPLDAVDDALPLDIGHAAAVVTRPLSEPATRAWRLRALTRHPDGRLFFLAEGQFRVPHPNQADRPGGIVAGPWLPHLVSLDTGGELAVHRWPEPPTPATVHQQSVLVRAESLAYDGRFDAILAFPLDGMEFSQRNNGVQSGVGALVMPLGADEPNAYLSLTEATLLARCGDSGQTMSCAALSDLQAALPLPEGRVALTTTRSPLVLELDPMTLDLDLDGLTAAEEAVHGSSDYRQNSDGVGAPDSYEILVLGSDPTDPSDDPPRADGFIRYAPSGLVRRILPGTADFRTDVIRGGAPGGPLCVRRGYCDAAGGCDDALGYCVRRGDALEDAVPFRAAGPGEPAILRAEDGSHLVRQDAAGIWRISTETGAETLALAASELTILGDGAPGAGRLEVVSANPGLLWVAWRSDDGADSDYRVAVKRGDEPLTVVYDHQQARCDSGLGPCASWTPPDLGTPTDTPHDLMPWAVRVAGWIAESQRLVLAVAGTWDKYLVGLHADEPPWVMAYGGDISVGEATQWMPRYFQPTGHGDYAWLASWSLTTQGSRGPSSTTLVQGGLYDGWSGFVPSRGLDGWLYNHPSAAFWGDIMAAPGPSTGAAWELVRYDGFAEAGDLLYLGTLRVAAEPPEHEVMMFRSGPRGGLAAEWGESRRARDPWGLDVNRFGVGCLVDRGSKTLSWLAPEPQLLTPTAGLASWAVGDAVDCAIDDDEVTWVLIADPPSLYRYETPWSAPELVETYASTPVTFVDPVDDEEAGPSDVFFSDEGLRARQTLSDGRVLTIPQGGWDVLVGGVEVASLTGMLPGWSDDHLAWARVVERPDGLVVVQAFGAEQNGSTVSLTGPKVVDVGTGQVVPLTDQTFYATSGAAMARLPGGTWLDPWAPATDRGRETAWPEGPGTEDLPIPDPPIYGEEIAVGSVGDDGGCHGAGGALWAWWAALALMGAWMARRRADEPVRPR